MGIRNLFEKLSEIAWLLNISQRDALDIKDCARFLNLSTDHLRSLACRNEIPHYKCQGKLYFSKREVDNWRLQRKIHTNSEMKEIAHNLNFTNLQTL